MKKKDPKKNKTDYVIQSVVHAIDLLESFKGDYDEMGVTELSKRLDLHKNNVFRLLATLESRGYIEQNKETGNYRLGIKVLELGQEFVKHIGLLKQAQPVMRELLAKCNENVYVSVLRGNNCIYIDGLESSHVVKVMSRIGHRLPIHATASGKVLVAGESMDEVLAMLTNEALTSFTKNTITSREAFIAELKHVHEQGFAMDNEELDEEVRCIAAPIKDYMRKTVGAVSISAPSARMDDSKIDSFFAPLIKETALEISRRLGYSE